MSLTATCPCGRSFPVPEFMVGQSVTCSKCGSEVPIRKPGGAPAAPAAPAAATPGTSEQAQAICRCGNRIKMSSVLLKRGVPCAQCGAIVTLGGSPGAAPVEAPIRESSPRTDPPRDTASRKPGAGAPPPPDLAPPPPPAPPPEVGGVQPCGSCAKLFDSTAKVCPFCGVARSFAGIAQNRRAGDLTSDTFNAFVWGFRGIIPLVGRYVVLGMTYVGLSYMLGFLFMGATAKIQITVGLLLMAWGYGHTIAIAFQVIKAGAARMSDFPELPSLFDVQSTYRPFLQLLGWQLFSFAPSIVVWILSALLNSGLLLLLSCVIALICLPVFTLGFVGIAVHDHLFGLSPSGILRSIVKGGGPIFFSLGMSTVAIGVGVGVVVLGIFIATMAGAAGGSLGTLIFGLFIAAVISMPVSCYFQSVYWRMLGVMYYHLEEKLEIVRKD